MTTPPLNHAVLMCHAPIVIPEVAGERAGDCRDSTAGMRAAGAFLAGLDLDALVVLSPHTPRHPSAFTMAAGDVLRGDFGAFRAPQVRFELPVARDGADAIAAACRGVGLPHPQEVRVEPLDHGAAVPLYFAWEAGWRGPTVLMGFPFNSNLRADAALGEAVAAAADVMGQRWALLASGDMSHRLLPGAPAGFDPRAREFDAWIVDRVREGDYDGATAVDGRLRRLAAEDVVDSVAVASAACQGSEGHRLLSYEGPFGVGYLVAILKHVEEAS